MITTNNNGSYDKAYYERYHQGRFIPRGDKPILYKRWIKYFHRRLPSANTFLDIGCGEGYFCRHASKDFHTIGIDISQEALILAKEHSPQTLFMAASAMGEIPLKDNSVDIVVSCDVLEHLAQPALLLKEIHRILKPSGLSLLSTPNSDSLGKKLKKEKWFGYCDKTHISIYPDSTWKELMKESCLTVISAGSDFFWDIPYPIYLPLLLQKSYSIPLNMFIQKYWGFLPWSRGENLWYLVTKGS